MRLHLAISLFTLPLPAFAFGVPNCPPPSGVSATQALADFPAPVMNSLAKHVPNLSAPDAAFNLGDALVAGQTDVDRRLITAFHRDNRWVIAYEAGGRAYYHIVVAYDVAPDGNTSKMAFKSWSNSRATCAMLARGLTQNEITYPYW